MALDTDVRRENTDVRWVGFHPPKIETLKWPNIVLILEVISTHTDEQCTEEHVKLFLQNKLIAASLRLRVNAA
jgi:hypothetical protein